MTKVMSLTAVMALLAQGGAPNPKIPIPQRPLEGHVVISSVKPSVLEQNVCFTMPPEVRAHAADPTTSTVGDPLGALKNQTKNGTLFWYPFGPF